MKTLRELPPKRTQLPPDKQGFVPFRVDVKERLCIIFIICFFIGLAFQTGRLFP